MTSPPRGAPSITMVRHGESEWNAEGLVQGQNDTSQLTELGRAQARDLADALAEMNFDRLVASDLRRTVETAAILGAALGLSLELDALLRERCFGVVEGRPSSELTSLLTGHAQGVILDGDARPEGGESLRDVVRRAGAFLDRATVAWPTERLLVVTHGGMVNAMRLFHAGEPLEGQAWYRVGNCEVWDLERRLDVVPGDRAR